MQGTPSPFGLSFTLNLDYDDPIVSINKNWEARKKLVQTLQANGIDCRLPTGGSFTKHPYGSNWRSQKTPNADRIHETGLFLGNAPFSISDKIDKAVKVIKHTL